MEFCLELMSVIRPNIVYPKGKKFNHIVYKVNGVGLGMPDVDFQGSNARGIFNSCVLKTLNLPSFPNEDIDLNINLYVMPRGFLVVAFAMKSTFRCSRLQP